MERVCYYSNQQHTQERAAGSSSTFQEVRSSSDTTNPSWRIIASEWIESKTEYAYNTFTKLFSQPALASSILTSLVTANPTSLSSIKSKSQIGKYKAGTSIAEICKQAKDNTVETLEGVLATLAEQTEVPVLVAIDEVQALFSTSGLRTPDYRILESYDLSTPRLFLDYLTGKKTFVSSSLYPSTTSTSHPHPLPILALPHRSRRHLTFWHHRPHLALGLVTVHLYLSVPHPLSPVSSLLIIACEDIAEWQSKGMIITSLSHSTPSLPIPLTLYEALAIPSPTPLTAYTKHNPTHLEHAKSGMKKIDVAWNMSSEEAVGIWKIWSKKGWARGEFLFWFRSSGMKAD